MHRTASSRERLPRRRFAGSRVSSIVVGVKLQKEGRADAFVSAGSTGAVMARPSFLPAPAPGSGSSCHRHHPSRRPAEPTLLLDAGANVDCKPHHLLQFAHLGRIYAQDLMGVENPRVGLLNIGEEPEKGNELSVESHKLLRTARTSTSSGISRAGRSSVAACDVLVCDGFDGNLILKFYESVAEFIIGLLETGDEGAPRRRPRTSTRSSASWTTRSTVGRPCWA